MITISSDSDGPAIIEEVPETLSQALGKDKTEGVTETVEVESLPLGSNDHPDDDIMETVEELGWLLINLFLLYFHGIGMLALQTRFATEDLLEAFHIKSPNDQHSGLG